MFKGIPVSKGVTIGKVYLLDRSKICILRHKLPTEEIPQEIERFNKAIQESKSQIQSLKQRAQKVDDKYAIILDTYILLLEDDILVKDTVENIKKESLNAEWALTQTLNKFNNLFDNINDEYLKGKKDDLDLVVNRIIRNLTGHEQESLSEIEEPVVIVAHALSPSDTLSMNRKSILGFATEAGGKTSHVGIMASAFGIPAVVGVRGLTGRVNTGDSIIIDGIDGMVIVNPSEKEFNHYLKKQQNYQYYERKLLEDIKLKAKTKDGHEVTLLANIESSFEIKSVIDFGAEGVGLYRTEYLYMGRNSFPDEEELFEDFKKIVKGMDPHPVVIRTLDVGGDKILRKQQNDGEDNPALGLRGIRMSLVYPEMFLSQLKGILRSSLYGKVKILYPMVSFVDEIIAANKFLEQAKQELKAAGIPFDEDIEIGAMIETPAAALCVEDILKVVDFLSIGTNDLIQYVLAVDRINESVAHLYQPLHPSVLKLLKNIFKAANEAAKKVSICGELGGDPLMTPLVLGLGKVDELSMDPHSIPKVKKIIRSINMADAKKIADRVLQLTSAEEINRFVTSEMRAKFPYDFNRGTSFEERLN